MVSFIKIHNHILIRQKSNESNIPCSSHDLYQNRQTMFYKALPLVASCSLYGLSLQGGPKAATKIIAIISVQLRWFCHSAASNRPSSLTLPWALPSPSLPFKISWHYAVPTGVKNGTYHPLWKWDETLSLNTVITPHGDFTSHIH